MGADWRRPPMPAQFALRVAILGGIGLVVFAIIFLRLWYLEVLSGDQYLAEAQNNQVREFTVQAPRGEIVDRNGEVLVNNRTALELQVNVTDLPNSKQRRQRLFDRVGEFSGLRPAQIRNKIRSEAKACAACPVTLRRDVPYDTVYYLRENQDALPRGLGRARLRAPLPAGHAGRAPARLRRRGRLDRSSRTRATRRLQPGDQVGKDGVENDLRQPPARHQRRDQGPGRRRGPADRRPALPRASRRPGNDLVLTIDDAVQRGRRAGDRLDRPPGRLRRDERPQRRDPRARLEPQLRPLDLRQAAGPSVGLQGAHRRGPRRAAVRPRHQRLLSDRLDVQADHRARGARLGRARPERDHQRHRRRSRSATARCSTTPATPSNGPIELRQALKVSSDVFFYTLGCRMDNGNDTGDGGPLQQWARALGIGQPTGPRRRRRGRGPAADAGVAQRSSTASPRSPIRRAARTSCRTTSTSTAVSTGRGPWATTSTSRSARATCRPTRCRWRSPTRRSPTAATSSGRTSGSRVEDPQGRVDPGDRPGGPRPRRHRPRRPARDPGRPARRRDGAGRHLLSGLRRLPGRHRRQDRHRGARSSGRPTSPGTWRWRRTTTRSTWSR